MPSDWVLNSDCFKVECHENPQKVKSKKVIIDIIFDILLYHGTKLKTELDEIRTKFFKMLFFTEIFLAVL